MSNPPLVSIIVPIYKVEPYLRCNLDSIINQTYTNLEIILVDDGSPDGCPQICDEYAAKDNRIIVIHKENGGLSDARNAGLAICKGEYISFVDSDDWINNSYIDILFKVLKKGDAEIAICSYATFIDGEESAPIHQTDLPNYVSWNSHETLIRLCAEDTLGLIAAWGKLYKKEIFYGIRFPKGKLYEDAYINYRLYSQCKRVCFMNIPLYHYRIRQNSIMTNTKGSIYDLEAKLGRYYYLKKHNEKAASYCIKNLCWSILFAASQPNQFFENNLLFSNREEALICFKKNAPDFFKCKHISLFNKILLFPFFLFPHSYFFYRRISPIHLRKD